MIITKLEAIRSLDPTLAFSLDAEGTLTLGEIDGAENIGVLPTEAEITAELTRLQAEYDSKQYQRNRAKAYPSLQDQADMQFHDAVDGTTTWQDAIQAVKDAYPKP